MYTHISPFYHALTMALDGWILALCRVKIHVTGLEKVPTDTEYLFVSNHRSNFDPMVQWWVLRRWRLAFVSKPSNMRKFVIGPFVRRCCFLPIDRENARNALTTINAAEPLGYLHLDHGILRGPFVHAERGVAAAFERQPFEVHVGDDQLFLGREAFGFAQDRAVLGDDAVAGEHEVGGGFAEACRAVDVGRDRAGRLLGDQLPQVGVLARRLG